MNINEIINYLKSLNDSTYVDLINNTYTTLIRYNVDENFLQELNNLIFTNSVEPDNDILDSINILIDNIFDNILRLLGVELNDSILLSNKLEILDGIMELETYTDKEAIIRLIETDYNDSELFGELLQLVTPFNTEEILSYINNINSVFKEAIIRLIKEEITTIDVSAIKLKHKTKLDKYSKFKGISNNRFGDQFYDNILTIGLPFENYFNIYVESGIPIIMDDIANDLVSMAILSEDSEKDTYINIIRKHLSKVKPDANESSKLDTLINKILIGLNNNG